MKVMSFDFDSTLSRQDVQDYAVSIMKKGIDVWVVTARFDDLHKHRYPFNPTNEDLYAVVDKIGIPRCKIRFMCMEAKHLYLYESGVLVHLDDDYIEINGINKFTNTVGISVVGGNGWKNKCNKILEL